MSALARYYQSRGMNVAGYDRVATNLTGELSEEGIDIHFVDSIDLVPEIFIKQKTKTLVVYTPAVPADHNELKYFTNHGYKVIKRAEALGIATKDKKTIAIAGTHGKTTTTTLTAHLFTQSEMKCNAFMGGISKNYGTNLLLSPNSDIIVVEADEFDRSFLQLHPDLAVITSADADHLDIYGSRDEIRKTFNKFISQIKPGGKLVIKKDLDLDYKRRRNIDSYTYSLDQEADFYAKDISIKEGLYHFDLVTPFGILKDLNIGTPGLLNVENSIAATALALLMKIDESSIRESLISFKGVKRRFDFHFKSSNVIYIDDYAHHPVELRFCIESVKNLFPGKKITGIFQPHLYSRTRDFAAEFAESLSLLDELILLDIYPARELPIKGVTSDIIFDKVDLPSPNKTLCQNCEIIDLLKEREIEILLTMGAGDIDKYVGPITNFLEKKYGPNSEFI